MNRLCMSREKIKKMKSPLGPHIKQLRLTLEMSQEEMAEALGVKPRAYFYWESGDRTPRGKHLEGLQKLARSEGLKRFEIAATFLGYRNDLAGREPVAQRQTVGTKSNSQIYRACLNLEVAVSILKEQARGGSDAALQKLLDLADRATRLAGDQSTAKEEN